VGWPRRVCQNSVGVLVGVRRRRSRRLVGLCTVQVAYRVVRVPGGREGETHPSYLGKLASPRLFILLVQYVLYYTV
jgi:hypothetical protein